MSMRVRNDLRFSEACGGCERTKRLVNAIGYYMVEPCRAKIRTEIEEPSDAASNI